MAKTLIIVDVQPEYEDYIGDVSPYIEEIKNYGDYEEVLVLYNGEETLGMIPEWEYREWLRDKGVDEDALDEITLYDKGYAFFRYCMDSGIDDEVTANLVRYMYENDVNDSRDLDEEFWDGYVEEYGREDLRELLEFSGAAINLPDLMWELKDRNDIVLIGGGVNECLKEVEIALDALKKDYETRSELTYEKGGMTEKKKLFRGGELENYNKWKSIDWDSFKIDPKKRSNIYRLLGWSSSERIDWDKMPEEDREWFENDVMYELSNETTLDYIFSDQIEALDNQFDVLMDEDKAETDKGVEELLKTEYSDFKKELDELGLTWKDFMRKSNDEIKEEVYEGKDTEWVIDYFLLNDDNWQDWDYVFSNSEHLDELYYKVLERGAVFTEEEEEQQYDLFQEKDEIKGGLSDEMTVSDIAKKHGVKESDIKSQLEKGIKVELEHTDDKQKAREIALDHLVEISDYYDRLDKMESESLGELIDQELEALNDLLDDAKEEKEKDLISELEERIEFLEDLKEDEVESFDDGGLTKSNHKELADKWAKELSNPTELSKGMTATEIDEKQSYHYRKGNPQEYTNNPLDKFSKINIIFNDKYDNVRLDFYGVMSNGVEHDVGWASSKPSFTSANTLNLHEIVLSPEYDSQLAHNQIVELIKSNMKYATGKTELEIEKSKY